MSCPPTLVPLADLVDVRGLLELGDRVHGGVELGVARHHALRRRGPSHQQPCRYAGRPWGERALRHVRGSRDGRLRMGWQHCTYLSCWRG